MSRLKIIGVASGVAAMLMSVPIAFAQEDDATSVTGVRPIITRPVASTTRSVKVEAVREEAKTRAETAREEAKQKMETQREEAKTRMENAREEAKTRMETAREVAKTKMETQREEAKQKMETKREETKTRMEAQREKTKQRVADIRDKAKQEMATKIADQFDNLNKKWTDRFTEQLGRLGEILLKIQERADIASTNGKDITATNTAIQSANTAIDNARTAVVAQAAKTYTLDTSSIATTVATTTTNGQDELMKGLRTQFQNLHKTLFKDLFALRDGEMKRADTAVRSALKTLSQIPKVDDDDDSTDDSDQ